MGLRGRGAAAAVAAVLVLSVAACSGDGGDENGDENGDSGPTSAATSGETDEATDATESTAAATGMLCDVLTAELAAGVDPAITRQTLNTADQCGWSGKGAVLLLGAQTLDEAGVQDEDEWFDLAAEQYGVPLTDLDIGDRGAVLRDPDGAIVQVQWTVDHVTYWTLLGTFKQDDDATYDAVVEVARTIASG